ncbi:hypothetical protein Pfo_004900 [Paulownia fortunei]|nr:hypothetical protein Pfo_004900 [Paulownia fortunei]
MAVSHLISFLTLAMIITLSSMDGCKRVAAAGRIILEAGLPEFPELPPFPALPKPELPPLPKPELPTLPNPSSQACQSQKFQKSLSCLGQNFLPSQNLIQPLILELDEYGFPHYVTTF